jgi:hypothetical protein
VRNGIQFTELDRDRGDGELRVAGTTTPGYSRGPLNSSMSIVTTSSRAMRFE